ncbi:MAG: hypothetical protein DI534_11200 [Leifsonia xyli]|nr:MAG: hypothetical protein DI534_11200 [Leifsonia xyli]
MFSFKAADGIGLATLAGTLEKILPALRDSKADQVVAVAIRRGGEHEAHAIAETVERIVPLIGKIVGRRQKSALDSIVEALVPDMPVSHEQLTEALMVANARRAVIESGGWLTAAQVAEIGGFSQSNPSAQPNRWKRDGLIWALRHRGQDYYPAYALDPGAGYRPIKALSQVLGLFADVKDDWGVAYWFASVNSFLGGRRPQDLLATAPEKVIAAAQDEVVGVLHG